MAKSAENRHHRSRMIARWLKAHPPAAAEVAASNESEWRFMAARIYAKTRKPCTCSYCTSSRKLYGNGKASRTFQERRHPVEFD